ncbi:pyridoxal phosphate-dependent aminotransferase [Aeromicrobium fastidiosum]|uniref:Pyridoxal phosphate-dependent aminotransferase n=1 Tax=Aeromicrobium fastidiosum TaxID=52699 RepID=A0A641AVF5_9ACTN|nr:pyridoxal phosphate-dependent aminotransferase [Aeromicrobium fastidiosum]KAA1380798.1 pyridoxal phosphate-dependent aminotransferase [Aeromicrobium fastidiosum]MBP2390421.1 N-succinyldiaminopimelate aminotransferase [Aeromicrobium fastidiosum]
MKTSSRRIAGLGTTIFAEMSALAARTGAINLGQGFPDTDGPDEVVDHAVQALRSGRNQYAPGIGVPELRDAIAHHQQRFYGLTVDPDEEVAVTTGATEAIAAALLGLVDPGDEIIVLEPYYDSYVAMIQMSGAVRRPVTLRAPDFRLPVDELRAAASPRTTAILLNTPHNPTGTVLRRDELEAIAALAIEHDLVVISDEVYEHLTFDGVPHVPIASLPGMAERTLTISSGGKSFSFTGWKIGWATGPAPLVQAMVGAKQFLTYTSGSPLQPAIAHALMADDDFFTDLATRLQEQRDLLCDGLADLGLDVFVPAGTYFATTDIRPLGFEDGLDFCRRLPELAGVVAIPHQVFHDDLDAGRPLVRWAFCKRPDVIAEALDRLQALRR